MTRRKFTSKFKTKVVLDSLSERYTIQELASKYQLHSTQISSWKTQFLSQASSIFEQPTKNSKSKLEEKEEQYLKAIGQQKMEIDFLKKALS
jgi:transposase